MEENIPDLRLDEQRKIAVQTIDIPLKINGEVGKVVIRKLSTGIRNKIRNECTETKIIGGQPSVKVNGAEIQEKILSECIVTAPFEKTLAGIKELPAEVSDYLFNEYSKFAEPSDKKKD